MLVHRKGSNPIPRILNVRSLGTNRNRGLIFSSINYLNLKIYLFVIPNSGYSVNKQKVLLDFEDFLNSYKDKKQADSSVNRFFPILSRNALNEDFAFLIGKIMGDCHLDSNYTQKYIGKQHDLLELKKLIMNKFKIHPNRFSLVKRKSLGVSYLLQLNYCPFGRILFLLGAPPRE